MELSFVIIHTDCPALKAGVIPGPPKFNLTDFDDTGRILTLTCPCCSGKVRLDVLEDGTDAEVQRTDAGSEAGLGG